MDDRYHFAYGDNTVYANVLGLIRRCRSVEGDVVADIGCGYGAIAEPLRDLGLTYIGFDIDADALSDLEERGFETERIDLSDVEGTVSAVEKRLSGRRLSALTMIDSLEHVTNGREVLDSLRQLALSQAGAVLVVSIPNVTHIDLAGKLLLGRWDVTETGLLDETHLAFFSPARLESMTRTSGWTQIGAHDFKLPFSDQHFPPDAATLQPGAPLHDLLFRVREQAADGVVANQFVRAFAPIAVPAVDDEQGRETPFLSVLMRTQGTRHATIEDALLSLAAQSSQDFEVVILPHDAPRELVGHLRYVADSFPADFAARVHIVPVDGGGRSRPLNVGIDHARGRYVAVLDDDDVVFGNWVETFQRLAAKSPGRILRSIAAEQDVQPALWGPGREGYEITGRPSSRWPEDFDVVNHLFENHSPPCGYALPRSAFADLGIRFDETLPVLEDWDVLMRVALLCGVIDSGEVTALWRRWETGESSTSVHTEFEWLRARSAVTAKLDAKPLLLPRRSVTTLHGLVEGVNSLRAERDHLLGRVLAAEAEAASARQQVRDVWSSTSWKLAAPVRALGSLARRVLARLR